MSPEFRANVRATAIIIAANVTINIAALFGYNAMRQHAMEQARIERATLSKKMDDAWVQRITLTRQLEQTCRK